MHRLEAVCENEASLRNLQLKIQIAILIQFLLGSTAIAFDVKSPAMQLPANQASAHERYLTYLESFEKKLCTAKVEKEFDRLTKARKKLTLYVPELETGELDVETIKKSLPQLEKKWKWLIEVRTKLQKMDSWPDRKKIFNDIEKILAELLSLKEKHFLSGDKSNKLKKRSRKLLKELQQQYESLVNELFFLQGFSYPVDHLKQRKLFDQLNVKDPKLYTRQANEVMFLRRLQEDGTDNDQHNNPDIYLRTTLNTLSIKLKNADTWIDEELRHDLEWALRRMDQQLRYGKKEQISRIQNWINNVAGARKFYSNLLDKEHTHEEMQLFISKREASWKLKEFVYSETAKVYKELLDQDEFLQAYFVFDQVLLNEAGNATVENFRDREDIAGVLVNSRFHPKLSVISEKEDLYKYLVAAGVPKAAMATPSWLNAMFKSLRFSFTLYYIPAVKFLFCPDFYKTAQSSRSKNLFITWNALKSPDVNFKALRYFSRWSMLGRIDMSDVWQGFKELPEKPGAQFKNDKNLEKKFKEKKYRYLYSFTDPKKDLYHVLEIGNKNYSVLMTPKGPDFFSYRDIHQFRFFEEK